jgi:hypothetical protein
VVFFYFLVGLGFVFFAVDCGLELLAGELGLIESNSLSSITNLGLFFGAITTPFLLGTL